MSRNYANTREPQKWSRVWAQLPFMRGPIEALHNGEPTPAEGGYCPAAYAAARIALAAAERD